MFYSLPPVGNKISLKSDTGAAQFLSDLLHPYRVYYFNSGAASLAIGLKSIMLTRNMTQGEVLLPAYACPEIVSAIQYAGATPVLVDLEMDTPRMSLDDLDEKLNANTIAVIAVSLFGLSERTKKIQALTGPLGVVLVEDHAQCFFSEKKILQCESEMLILSFGRGKPVSILTGGAVLVKEGAIAEQIDIASSRLPTHYPPRHRLKTLIYNQMISPYCYWFPDALPFLGLGKTVYKPLLTPQLLSDNEKSLIPDNVKHYWTRSEHPQQWVNAMLDEQNSSVFIDIATSLCGKKLSRLLRYPVLAESRDVRDTVVKKLKVKGLGVSCMYPLPVNQIPGLIDYFSDKNKTPNAANFASRIFTLPVHAGVRKQDVDSMGRLLKEAG